ncbi:conserved protein of unknown function [Acidithiobacillus ferrivorans]|uniref:Uncharacterized protein n=1 Tax=Acidithiobacillus ferrivorans TaxID=160808 RepID=A0A060UQV4_9PROT|nr:hypothetical protein [Acidithiobacillus ferrivorans]CDQ10676.1 conserved hypothetical protein [Acidithiobacillus ferrivorans]SMH64702.1 conserved protein of unknown function [Acidithiobacillus ferrivorans]
MNITVQHTEVGRYALISTAPGSEIALLLDDAIPTAQSIRRHAEALRLHATPKIHPFAALIDEAADRYEMGIQ